MNTEDASSRSHIDGNTIMARNNRASLLVALQITDKVRPGTAVPEGKRWCHPIETVEVGNRLASDA